MNLKKKIKSFFYEKEGKLTEDLNLDASCKDLGLLPERLLPDSTTDMVCGFCGTGCSLKVHMKEGRPVNITATQDYPVNKGEACPKGWEALTPLFAKDRVTSPLKRNKHGKLEPVTWDEGIETFVSRMKEVQEKYGPESVAFLSTGQIPTEEMALLGALAKFGMGIVHGDGNTRQCMASAVVAYKQSFGFDSPPFTYQDFEESDVLIFVGANPCIAHPIMWERVLMNSHNPQIVVIDPRATETAMAATHHYAIKPKSDLLFFYGIAKILIEKNYLDREYLEKHTEGFLEFSEHVLKYSLEEISEHNGLSVKKLEELAELIGNGKRVSFWWTMGVNQSHQGVRTAQAIINIALMTGNIGRPGTGPNSITGQCNAMGSRLFSNTTGLLGGHDFLNVEHRKKIANFLKIDVKSIPEQNSWAYPQIIEGIVNGKIKALWVIATNPLHSWVNRGQLPSILKELDFLVVQDMYHTTETAQEADLVLPAAAWGEKEGTFVNSERRFGLVKKVSKAPGEALSDFYIFKLIAEAWGCADMFQDWSSPEEVFHILKKLSKGQPCDFSGIKDYQELEEWGGIQWPCPEGYTLEMKERRLFEDGQFYHPNGKAKFCFEDSYDMLEKPREKYPFILLTGRGTSAQWHTQTRTSKSSVLRKLYPKKAYIEVNVEDAKERNIKSGDKIYIVSARGQVSTQALVVPTIPRGQLFMPMHYFETNELTFPSFDPYSHQPSYKSCAVNIISEDDYCLAYILT
jgi:assimilatory nitrate reductase catalytic subunit